MSRDSRYFCERMVPDIVVCLGVPSLVFAYAWWISTDHFDSQAMCIGLALITTVALTWWLPGWWLPGWWLPGWWLGRSREQWWDRGASTAQGRWKRAALRILWPGWLRRLVSRIPIRVRMGLVLASGLLSMTVGIGIWWPIVAAGEFGDTEVRIPTYFLAYVFASVLGVALLRRFFVLRRESRRRVPALPEPVPEPSQACRFCKQGHLIPKSIAACGCFSVVGYLAIAIGCFLSAMLAHYYLRPFDLGLSTIDGRFGDLTITILFLLFGWGLSVRTTVFTCDYCHQRSYPRSPHQRPEVEPEDTETESTRED